MPCADGYVDVQKQPSAFHPCREGFSTADRREAVFTRYWPISQPTANSPWVLGQPNYVSFITGGDSSVESFDFQLHNVNKSIMTGFIKLALLVPLKRLPSVGSNYGAQLEVDLDDGIPTG